MSGGPRPSTAPLRWFGQSPLAIAALLSGLTGTAVVDRAVRALDDARSVRDRMEVAAARIVAESAAGEFVGSGGAVRNRVVDVGGGIVVQTYAEPLRGADQVRLVARVGSQRFDYLFTPLSGGTSPVFGQALTAANDALVPDGWRGLARVPAEQLPRLTAGAEATASSAARLFVADPGLALLRLPAGTDRDDFVLAVDPAAGTPVITAYGVATVDGNLWLDCAERPLDLHLDADLTIVVRGNLYLGRSLRIHGQGNLTMVTVGNDGGAFVDRDGNGRHSPGEPVRGAEQFAGPMEGAGNVWIGLPREGAGRLDLDVGLVVGGVLHVAADRAEVHGPVILQRGGAAAPGRSGLLIATGSRLPTLNRLALPGFATVGQPRPGPLQQLGGEPLYPAAPAR